MFVTNIFLTKDELINWKKEMLTYLSKKIYKKEIIYLIRKQDLDYYEKRVFNSEIMNDNVKIMQQLEKHEQLNSASNELLKELNNPQKELNTFQEIFPLNKESYKFLTKIKLNKDNNQIQNTGGIISFFEGGLLKIKINDLLILFFFEDDGNLRQGFLRVKDRNLLESKMEEFEKNGPSYFTKNYKGDLLKDEECIINEPDFDLYIFERFGINIEKVKKEFEKINEEKIIRSLTKSMPLKNKFKINAEEVLNKIQEKCHHFSQTLKNIFNSTLKKSIRQSFNISTSDFTFAKNESNNLLKQEEKNNKDHYEMKDNDALSKTAKLINFETLKDNIKDSIIINNEGDKINDINDIKLSEKVEQEPTNIQRNLSMTTYVDDSSSGLIGLENIGATCYMNATLQCFSNIGFLRNELLDPEFYTLLEENKISKMRLSFALAEVLKNLWLNYNIKYYPPKHFKEVISDMNPLFQGVAANDPKDLILFILETMHAELRTNDPNIIVNENFVPDEHKLEEVYQDFANYYLSKNKSIILDIFYGCSNIVTYCLNCRSELHNVQVNNIIFFPLEEVRKYKNYNKETPVTINDCFEYNQKYDTYQSFYCGSCHNDNSTAISFTRNLYTPKVMIINLNRGKGIQFNVKFNYEEYLDIKNYVFGKDSPYKYELVGVICHFGESGMGGHFIAFIKHFGNYGCKWYKYNDAMVDECTFNDVQKSGMPYVLFYSYIDASPYNTQPFNI